MTLYWTNAGLKIWYDKGLFVVEDLNPELKIQHRLSRKELLWIGIRAILAAGRNV